jgi:hypothetical protein
LVGVFSLEPCLVRVLGVRVYVDVRWEWCTGSGEGFH